MPQCNGWTLDAWREAYRHELKPADILDPLRAELDPKDPAFTYVVSAAELQDQIAHLATLGNPEALPLYGIPCVIKDNIDVRGLPTTAACPAFSRIAQTDAECVARLRAAGAIVLAKTNLDQFATGLVGTRSPYGAVPNSFNSDYISGGSSSGSAVAVARGLVPFSLGTDTAGSGRVPAGFNNLVGLKPTRGRFSTSGVIPACRSLDCVSIFALSVGDAEQVAAVLEAFDPADGYSRHAEPAPRFLPGEPRLGIPAALPWFGDQQSAAAWQASLDRLRAMGCELVELDFTPMLQLAQLLYDGPWVAERYAAIADFIESRSEEMNEVVRSIICKGRDFSAADAFRAEYRRTDLVREIHAQMEQVDALLVPTAPRHPTLAEVEADPVGVNSQLGTWTNFVNLADCSALALPAGLRSDGLPFGITLIGAAWQDAALAEFGRRWQKAQPWQAGALGRPLPDPLLPNEAPPGHVRLAVVGAHLTGMPLNWQLTERHARFIESTVTSDCYRLYALPNTTPPKPGLVRADSGAPIAVELWDVPLQLFGGFVALIPAPLGIGTLTLGDGREVKGFICEGAAVQGATDITHLGGWRAYIASLQAR
ncbi:allophanate hydrolase [Pseudomonas sp.]|uniref:allophanate hydrolase n=1 Tax=Pseudomonas sp. TaxID=306 RepID=UPI00272A052D|nr:allophanate hydrolase [Pseudomonas sp.]